MSQRHDPVDEVGIGTDQLVVNSVDEFVPTEVRIMPLWHIDRQVVSQGIRIVSLQERGQPHPVFPALTELPALQHQVLICGNVVFQRQFSWSRVVAWWFTGAGAVQSHYDGWPYDCVKRNVVLAHEVNVLRRYTVRVHFPPILPCCVA